MVKPDITNHVHPAWNDTIKTLLNSELSYLPSDFERVEVSLVACVEDSRGYPIYECKIKALERSGLWHVARHKSADGQQAFEQTIFSIGRSVVAHHLPVIAAQQGTRTVNWSST